MSEATIYFPPGKKSSLPPVLLSNNPQESKGLTRKLCRIQELQKRRQTALEWNQRHFFMTHIFDNDMNFRFTEGRGYLEDGQNPNLPNELTQKGTELNCKKKPRVEPPPKRKRGRARTEPDVLLVDESPSEGQELPPEGQQTGRESEGFTHDLPEPANVEAKGEPNKLCLPVLDTGLQQQKPELQKNERVTLPSLPQINGPSESLLPPLVRTAQPETGSLNNNDTKLVGIITDNEPMSFHEPSTDVAKLPNITIQQLGIFSSTKSQRKKNKKRLVAKRKRIEAIKEPLLMTKYEDDKKDNYLKTVFLTASSQEDTHASQIDPDISSNNNGICLPSLPLSGNTNIVCGNTSNDVQQTDSHIKQEESSRITSPKKKTPSSEKLVPMNIISEDQEPEDTGSDVQSSVPILPAIKHKPTLEKSQAEKPSSVLETISEHSESDHERTMSAKVSQKLSGKHIQLAVSVPKLKPLVGRQQEQTYDSADEDKNTSNVKPSKPAETPRRRTSLPSLPVVTAEDDVSADDERVTLSETEAESASDEELCQDEIVMKIAKMLPTRMMIKAYQNVNKGLNIRKKKMKERALRISSRNVLQDPRWQKLQDTLIKFESDD